MSLGSAALLIGIPVDYDEFSLCVGKSDWLSKFDDADSTDTEREESINLRWRSEYEPLVAAPMQELINVADLEHVKVVRRATLADLRDVSSTAHIVILFAHWKGAEVLHEDISRPSRAEDFLERVEKASSPLGLWLKLHLEQLCHSRNSTSRHIGGSWWWRFVDAFKRPSPSLRDLLSEAISVYAKSKVAPTDGVDEVLVSTGTRAAQARDCIDDLFHGLVRPGNRLELFDGLHSKEDVESALCKDFNGILDLTTCTSTILADYVAAKRGHKFRTVQFPSLQEFIWAVHCVITAIRLCTKQGMSYQSARKTASDIVETTSKSLSEVEG
jgi:hypothetical protein